MGILVNHTSPVSPIFSVSPTEIFHLDFSFEVCFFSVLDLFLSSPARDESFSSYLGLAQENG